MPLTNGQTLQGRYRIISLLGQGGMGAVYLAEDMRLTGRRCAIKENIPDPNVSPQALAQIRQQFHTEASTLATLDHPNLPKVSDYFSLAGNEYIVMDYVEGEDLESALKRQGGPLPEKPVLIWADQALDALEYLHNHRPNPIIHRDIKPANIVLTRQGKIKLVDFGLVKLLDPNDPRTATVMKGMGTPEYTPLEQYASGPGHTDARSDIYSLGATLYHLLTDVAPLDAPQRLLNPMKLAPPRHHNPGLSAETEAAVLKAMEIYPDRRFQTAKEMREALARRRQPVVQPPPPQPVPAATTQPAAGGVQIPRWLWGAVVGGLLLLLAFIAFRPGGSAPRPVATSTARIVVVTTPVLLDTPSPGSPASTLVSPATTPIRLTLTRSPRPTATQTLQPAHAQELTLDLKVTARSWIRVALDGETVFEGTVSPSDERTWKAKREITLRTGNAGGIDVTVNGESLGALGKSGQVMEYIWTLAPDGEVQVSTPIPLETSADAGASAPAPTDTHVVSQALTRPGMVFVPAGDFIMGSETGESDERPVHAVSLDAFWIDRYEVTNEDFKEFVDTTGYRTEAEKEGWGQEWTSGGWVQIDGANWRAPQGSGSSVERVMDHPVVQVSWNDAVAYCDWVNKRLPTEAEWEKAARGDDSRVYPWGNDYDANRLNSVKTGTGGTKPVGSFETGKSPYGAYDMAGNVWEWVADWYQSDYYRQSPDLNPAGPSHGTLRVLRGGAWDFSGGDSRSTDRGALPPSARGNTVGFRCARNP